MSASAKADQRHHEATADLGGLPMRQSSPTLADLLPRSEAVRGSEGWIFEGTVGSNSPKQ